MQLCALVHVLRINLRVKTKAMSDLHQSDTLFDRVDCVKNSVTKLTCKFAHV